MKKKQQSSGFLLWTAVFAVLILLSDQFLVRVPLTTPGLKEIQVFYRDFRGRLLATLLQNPGIIRNRAKIEAAVVNARGYLRVVEEFGSFDAYLWRFVDGRPVVNTWHTLDEIPTSSPASDRLSRDLRQRGFKFVGSTICYAHMQAVGMVNDHTLACFRRQEIIAGY